MAELHIARSGNVKGVLALPEDTGHKALWIGRQVKPVSLENQVSIPEVSHQQSIHDGVQKDRKVSIDSGIGSLGSAEELEISDSDGKEISKGLESIYQGLFAQSARRQSLPEARQALEEKSCQPLMDLLGKYGLDHYGRGILEKAETLLDWCEKEPHPVMPDRLVRIKKKCEKLRAESDVLTRKMNLKSTAANLKKAIKKNEQLTEYKENTLKPAERAFDHIIYSLIDRQPATQELNACLQSIKALLPENVEVSAPIDSTIRTWTYNVLLERAGYSADIR
ncbi:hypothetical protein [Endozoicomonas sp.]|uniref:hypothetical protein n=1 Tax=Endozoicomonas sp. TaxID=1892382 RepID=UPI002887BF54|nr:hypothetical protein [Endozoicomonas sp.]